MQRLYSIYINIKLYDIYTNSCDIYTQRQSILTLSHSICRTFIIINCELVKMKKIYKGSNLYYLFITYLTREIIMIVLGAITGFKHLLRWNFG